MSGGTLGHYVNGVENALFDMYIPKRWRGTELAEAKKKHAMELDPMMDAEVTELVYDTLELLGVLDFYLAGDVSKDTYEAYLRQFKARYMDLDTVKRRLRAIVEALDDDLR